MLLSICNLSGGYGETDIISDINLEVAESEIVTIAGTNGAGKSTLSKAVLGLLPRLSGTIKLDGKDVSRIDPEFRISHGLGYVPQVANVFGSLTVLENLKVVRHVKERERRIDSMLDAFPALKGRLRQYASTLSGGERQMLAFARAMMSDPRLIVLDEPTAALAPALVNQIFDLVRELPKRGVAVFMVEQRARQALAISDKGYILDQGRVVLSGPASELLADERMAELYLGATH
ncbi:ABC transporter ATP-binding protein [Alcaligenaceae bacterium]|nr:ABC transporter ATP-binding protein [Alcaligenaceae bacterium]